MLHFNNRINTEQGQLNFYFNQESDFLYYISVTDKNRKSHIFNMQLTNSIWSLKRHDGCCENWIEKLEKLFANKIMEQFDKKNYN